jgi:cytochrome P450
MLPTRLGNWATTSHRICNTVLRDRRFGVAPADGPAPGPGEPDLSFLEMNPPDHTRLRRLVQPAFSPRRIAGYRAGVERTVAQLLDAAAATARFDLVSALAALFESLFELRRREPAGDLVSTLVAAEGDQVKPGELRSLCALLLIAGFETTVNLIGNAVNALLDHPDQWAALCADPAGLADRAVEETLRFDPPVQRTSRFALEPLELRRAGRTRRRNANTIRGPIRLPVRHGR